MKITKKELDWEISNLKMSVATLRSENNTLVDQLIAIHSKVKNFDATERQLVEFKTAHDKQAVELQNLREHLKQVTRDYHEQIQQKQNAQIASERLRRQRDAFRDALITVSDTTK